jgi:hypothetical protein
MLRLGAPTVPSRAGRDTEHRDTDRGAECWSHPAGSRALHGTRPCLQLVQRARRQDEPGARGGPVAGQRLAKALQQAWAGMGRLGRGCHRMSNSADTRGLDWGWPSYMYTCRPCRNSAVAIDLLLRPRAGETSTSWTECATWQLDWPSRLGRRRRLPGSRPQSTPPCPGMRRQAALAWTARPGRHPLCRHSAL